MLGISTIRAEHFGRISAELSTAGQGILVNDIWIAALAREHQLPLATHDAHFNRVDGIRILQW